MDWSDNILIDIFQGYLTGTGAVIVDIMAAAHSSHGIDI